MIKPKFDWYKITRGSIFIVFATIYGLITFVNHYLIKSNALDLGVANHAIYDFAHFTHNNFTTGLLTTKSSFFGDHFSPITLLYSPFYYIGGSYTALIFQWFSILFGGYGILKICQYYTFDKRLTVITLLHFFGIWGIISALSFDFHNNVLAAMFLPWLYYYFCKSNNRGIIIFTLLILLTKENMAFWLFFIHIGFAVKNRSLGIKNLLKRELLLAFVSLIYFYLATTVIMPHLSAEGKNLQLDRYAHLGNSLSEILIHIVKHPISTFKLLFVSHLSDAQYEGIKLELHTMIIVSGGVLLFFRPYLLLFIIPILGQKLLSNDPGFWGIGKHYSIELVPILSLALLEFINKYQEKKWIFTISIVVLLSTIFFNFKKIEHQKTPWYNKEFAAFYSPKHYRSNLQIKEIYNQLGTIPGDAKVSASSSLVPHLCNRHNIALFPNIFDADYILLLQKNRNHYPLNEEQFSSQLGVLKSSKDHTIQFDNGELIIFKKK